MSRLSSGDHSTKYEVFYVPSFKVVYSDGEYENEREDREEDELLLFEKGHASWFYAFATTQENADVSSHITVEESLREQQKEEIYIETLEEKEEGVGGFA